MSSSADIKRKMKDEIDRGDKKARLHILQKDLAAKMKNIPNVSFSAVKGKRSAPVLRLDSLNREIDVNGNLLNAPKLNSLSTLQVNINKQKRDAFVILKPEFEVNNPFFDARMGINKDKLLRPKKINFKFVDEGKWSKDAEDVKFRSEFGEVIAKDLNDRQAQISKTDQAGIINPNLIKLGERVSIKTEKLNESIPNVEWWDVPFLQSGSTYDDIIVNSHEIADEAKLKTEKITKYVEHAQPIEPPAETSTAPPQPMMLTKKEKKKLRTQRRLIMEKDKQEMIRHGVLEPQKPKVKMSNVMKVLGPEATQDPTKLEFEIRKAAAEREQAHMDRNIARKLTPSERLKKKEKKLFDDGMSTLDTMVSVYKITHLFNNNARFKVDVNAKQNKLTGCAVLSEGMSVVVVEGGAKSIRRYAKLMLMRVDWAVPIKEDDENPPVINKCSLVWQGSVAKPKFNNFFLQEYRSEAAAKKLFLDHGVGHYWDIASNFTDGDAVFS